MLDVRTVAECFQPDLRAPGQLKHLFRHGSHKEPDTTVLFMLVKADVYSHTDSAPKMSMPQSHKSRWLPIPHYQSTFLSCQSSRRPP